MWRCAHRDRVLTASDSPPSPSWRQELLAPSAGTATATVDTRAAVAPAPVPVAPGRRSRRGLVIAAVLALVALLVLAVAIVVTRDSGDKPVALDRSRRSRSRRRGRSRPGTRCSRRRRHRDQMRSSGVWTALCTPSTRATGTRSGGTSPGEPVRSSAAVDGERAYVGSFDGNLYALDTATGAEVWRGADRIRDRVVARGGGRPRDRGQRGTAGLRHDDRRVTMGLPARASPWSRRPRSRATTVFVGGNDGNVYAVGLDGTEQWRYPTGGAVRSSPVVADGVVYIGSTDGSLYALDAQSGALRWNVPLGSAVNSSPAVTGHDG